MGREVRRSRLESGCGSSLFQGRRIVSYEYYVALLIRLGYDPEFFTRGRLLRHNSNRSLPRVYFNRRRDGSGYFVIRRNERRYYPDKFWKILYDSLTAKSDSDHLEVVPKTGLELTALSWLRDQRLESPARYLS